MEARLPRSVGRQTATAAGLGAEALPAPHPAKESWETPKLIESAIRDHTAYYAPPSNDEPPVVVCDTHGLCHPPS